ncbi:MAG: transposase family protein, partial [Desulfobulbaceae bacterium]|nr:transposase family protein [Desulfobulbaceae bacterium]
FTQRCKECSATGKNAKSIRPPPAVIPHPTEPWTKLAIDITGPFANAPRKHRFIVVIIDYYSALPELLFMDDINSQKIIDWLEDIFGRFGNPREIISDNGPQFISTIFKRFLTSRSIVHSRTSFYAPQENGKVERFNRNIKSAAEIQSTQSTLSFRKAITNMVEMFCTTSPTEGKSPSEMLFGWKIRTSADIRNKEFLMQGEPTSVQDRKMDPSAVALGIQTRNAKEILAKYPGATKIRTKQRPFLIGDLITTEKPEAARSKGFNTRRPELQIQGTRGRYTYILSDGSQWNVRKLKRFNAILPSYSGAETLEIIKEKPPPIQSKVNPPAGD